MTPNRNLLRYYLDYKKKKVGRNNITKSAGKGESYFLLVLEVLATTLTGQKVVRGLTTLTAVRPKLATVVARDTGNVSVLVRTAS